MKRFLFAGIVLISLLVSSCSNELILPSAQEVETQETAKISYRIPLSTALESLNQFVNSTERLSTRGNGELEIDTVFPVVVPKKLTRSELPTDSWGTDTIMYAVNYTDERGYSLLAADTRIPCDIICVVEDGYIDMLEMNSALNEIQSKEKANFSGFPTSGDVIFEDSISPGYSFFNPNIYGLAQTSPEETLVGNVHEPLKYNAMWGAYDPNNVENMTERMAVYIYCLEFCINSINNYKQNDNRLQDIIALWESENDVDQGKGWDVFVCRYVYTPWGTERSVEPLLTSYKYWNQRAPFNDQCPIVPNFYDRNKFTKTSAGCFPLAIAKILTYFKRPAVYTFNGVTINWESLENFSLTNEFNTSAAYLLRGIGVQCHSHYYEGGTFTFPWDAKACLGKMLDKTIRSYRYRFIQCQEMLDCGKPVIIYALPSYSLYGIKRSHAWNIDGYEIRTRMKTTEYYANGNFYTCDVEKETLEMVHCDFGWGSKANGYYESRVFSVFGENTELDDPDDDYQFAPFTEYKHIFIY